MLLSCHIFKLGLLVAIVLVLKAGEIKGELRMSHSWFTTLLPLIKPFCMEHGVAFPTPEQTLGLSWLLLVFCLFLLGAFKYVNLPSNLQSQSVMGQVRWRQRSNTSPSYSGIILVSFVGSSGERKTDPRWLAAVDLRTAVLKLNNLKSLCAHHKNSSWGCGTACCGNLSDCSVNFSKAAQDSGL